MTEREYFAFKRWRKKFKIDKKQYKTVIASILDVWNSELVPDCTLTITRKGFTALVNEDRPLLDRIQIGMSHEVELYNQLKVKGLKMDFVRSVVLMTYHEIGHVKHLERAEIKRRRSMLRRQAYQSPTKGDFDHYANQVWDKTREIEMAAWDYVRSYVSIDECVDFQLIVEHCIEKHHDFWLLWRDQEVSRKYE